MRKLPHTPELEDVARNTVWFKPPAEALEEPYHFVAHVLTYGTHEDVRALRRYVSDDELRESLDHAPPGIFDPRSWAYWNLKTGRFPAPPLPQRTFTSCSISTSLVSVVERKNSRNNRVFWSFSATKIVRQVSKKAVGP